jgi:hypothetical protein
MRGLVVILLGLVVAGCSGTAAPSSHPPQPPGNCLLPFVPAAFLAYPPTGTTGVATTNVTLDYGLSGVSGAHSGAPTWSVTLIASGVAALEGGAPAPIASPPPGSAPPPWPSTTIGYYASALPTLQPNTTYTVDLTITWVPPPTTNPCAASTSTIGTFTTG